MKAALAAALVTLVTLPGCLDEGVSPYDYIRDRTYKTWVIEIDYVQEMAPARSATALLAQRMEGMVSKEEIEVRVAGSPVAGGRDTWTRGALTDLHERTQDIHTSGQTVVTHVLYVDGQYETAGVLGVRLQYDLVVIFKERIQQACSPLNACLVGADAVERAVLVHEFGHAIGLVNTPVPMIRNHEDTEHPGHSTNEESVMYWAVESFARVPFLSEIPDDFDADDRRDICEAGGRPACG